MTQLVLPLIAAEVASAPSLLRSYPSTRYATTSATFSDYQNTMTENQNPVLTFDGKTYNLSDLSDATKDLVAALQVADGQLRFAEDTYKVLSVGRQTLVTQLTESLADVKPVEEPTTADAF